MTCQQADALIVFLHRRQRRYHAEPLRMGGGIHTWILLTDREGNTCPPPFDDVSDFLTVPRDRYDLAPECRRLLGEWLRGGSGSGKGTPDQNTAPSPGASRRRLSDHDDASRFFSALVAAALQCHHRAALCQERGDGRSATRDHDDARRTARKGLRLLRRLRLRGCADTTMPCHDPGLSGLERTGADNAPRRRF